MPPNISALDENRVPNFLPIKIPAIHIKNVIIPISNVEIIINLKLYAPMVKGRSIPAAKASILVAIDNIIKVLKLVAVLILASPSCIAP